jgi:hypothetical protein
MQPTRTSLDQPLLLVRRTTVWSAAQKLADPLCPFFESSRVIRATEQALTSHQLNEFHVNHVNHANKR